MRGISGNAARRAARSAQMPGFAKRHGSDILADLANLEEEDLAARRAWEEDASEIIPHAGVSDF